MVGPICAARLRRHSRNRPADSSARKGRVTLEIRIARLIPPDRPRPRVYTQTRVTNRNPALDAVPVSDLGTPLHWPYQPPACSPAARDAHLVQRRIYFASPAARWCLNAATATALVRQRPPKIKGRGVTFRLRVLARRRRRKVILPVGGHSLRLASTADTGENALGVRSARLLLVRLAISSHGRRQIVLPAKPPRALTSNQVACSGNRTSKGYDNTPPRPSSGAHMRTIAYRRLRPLRAASHCVSRPAMRRLRSKAEATPHDRRCSNDVLPASWVDGSLRLHCTTSRPSAAGVARHIPLNGFQDRQCSVERNCRPSSMSRRRKTADVE